MNELWFSVGFILVILVIVFFCWSMAIISEKDNEINKSLPYSNSLIEFSTKKGCTLVGFTIKKEKPTVFHDCEFNIPNVSWTQYPNTTINQINGKYEVLHKGELVFSFKIFS